MDTPPVAVPVAMARVLTSLSAPVLPPFSMITNCHSASSVASDPHPDRDSPLSSARWIWSGSGAPPGDQYVCFRRSFRANVRTADATIDLSADTDFVAYLNGQEIGRGQFGDFPQRKTWSRFLITPGLLGEENVLAVLVHYRGGDFFDHQAGRPGLIAGLQCGELQVVTDEQWRAAKHPAFRSGQQERVTLQTGYTFHFDARLDQPLWKERAFDDSIWENATVVQPGAVGDYWKELSPRPLPGLLLEEPLAVRVVMQGSFIRPAQASSAAQAMAGTALRAEFPWVVFANEELAPSFPGAVDLEGEEGVQASKGYSGAPLNPGTFLSAASAAPLMVRGASPGTHGRYLVVDLGAETVGLLELEVEAAAGTLLEIAHGEHLDDGRVRAKIGARNFADRYICKAGRQRFEMPFRRFGGRYLEIHCSTKLEWRLYALTLRPVAYPTAQRSCFQVRDPLATRVHHVALRTLELCRHEHYEDSPWREQALYAYDARLQALYGYYAFGDCRFTEVSLTLLHQTYVPQGFLELVAPGRCDINIPVFSFTWVVALAEHWLYGGQGTLFENARTAVKGILEKALERFDSKAGLYKFPEGTRFWHFYEWTPGLAGETSIGEGEADTLFHAAYNLHLHEALRAYGWMLRQSGETEEAAKIGQRIGSLGSAIHHIFWDADARFYRSSFRKDTGLEGNHELVQSLAWHEGIVPECVQSDLMQTLITGNLRPCTLSALYYLVPPMLAYSPESRQWVDERLGQHLEKMIFFGASTLWETAAGGADFDFAGSLCHGWSALPVYYHHAAILGVRPLAPGFRKFAIQVHPSRFADARGTVPTPFGMISISWEKEGKGLCIDAHGPQTCEPVLMPFPEAPYLKVRYNGKMVCAGVTG